MSAQMQQEDKEWLRSTLKLGKFSELELSLINSAFDEQTDYDVTALLKQAEQIKYLRKVCLYKILMFPIDMILMTLILGYKEAKNNMNLYKLYYNFYRNKITFVTFQTKLQKLLVDKKII